MDEQLETAQTLKIPFFRRFIEFFKRIFLFRRNVVSVQIISRFRIILDEIGKNSPDYETAYNAVMLCEEAIRITRQRVMHAEKIKALSDSMTQVECFDALTEEESTRLQNLLNGYLSLSKEKSALLYQITEFDSSLSHILEMEEAAGYTADNVGEAEEYRRILKQDLGYLGGEKAELEYEREYLEKGQEFIRKFSIFMVSLFAFVTIILSFLYLFNGVAILLPMSVMTVMLIFVIFLLYLFRRRLGYELKLNHKKQTRAVELLNKKTAVFAHYQNYLNFVYKKYKVRNSQMLKKNLKDVKTYRHLTGRIDSLRKIMYQTQDEIEDFLRKKNMANLSSSVEHFAQTINVEDKKQYYSDLSKERAILENALENLDSRHEEIWDILIDFNDNDLSETRIMDRIIHAYLHEVEKVFATAH